MEYSGKVLIADDEDLACKALETMLNRFFPELEIVGWANSGKEAIDLYEKYHPDLVFMDIKMPGISGNEASSLILNKDRNARIIMLTAYDNFHYVQDALNIGVKAYLLKPIDTAALTRAVNKVLKSPKSISQNNHSHDVSEYLNIEIINAIVSHKPDWDKIYTLDNLVGNRLSGGFVFLVTSDEPIEELLLLLKENSTHSDILIAPVYGFIAGIVLISKQDYISGTEIRIANRIYNDLQNKFPNSCRMAYGSWGTRKEGIRHSFEQALEVLMNQSSPGIFEIQSQSTEDQISPSSESDMILQKNEILQALETGRAGLCRELVIKLIQHIRNIPEDFTLLKEIANELLVHLKMYAQKKRQIPDLDSIKIHQELSRIPGQRQLAHYLEELTTHFLGDEYPKGNQETKTLLNAFLYLQEHIFDDISLEQIADYSGVSPQYLSLKVKEKFGMNYIEYVTGKRLEYAQYLLLTSNDPVKDIALKSGYNDPNYFSRIFKKNIGVTPNQFRSDSREKER